jgi:hypothetical protein
MSEHLNKVLEFVESLSTKERINDGEYLDMMNSLKQINDNLRKPAEDTVYSDERYDVLRYNALEATRFGTFQRMKLLYLRPDAGAPLHNIVLWASEFETLIQNLTGEVDNYNPNKQIYSPIYYYLPWVRDEVANLILFSKHPISKRYIKEMLLHNLYWKTTLSQHSITKLTKDDLKDKKINKAKTHIIKVDINSPFKETFCMDTKYIRLGKENNALSLQLNKYIIKKLLENTGVLTEKNIKVLNHTLENRTWFNLVVSGIDAKTRTQKRQYSYKMSDFEYNVTYLTK